MYTCCSCSPESSRCRMQLSGARDFIFPSAQNRASSAPLPSPASLTCSHEAAHSRAQTQHPPRVHSTLHHSFLCRARCTPWCARRRASGAPMAPAMGRDSALTAAQGRSRQTPRVEQARGAATCAHPHPPGQPRAQTGTLLPTPSSGAAENGQRTEHPDSAPLRQGRAPSKAEARQEENIRGE